LLRKKGGVLEKNTSGKQNKKIRRNFFFQVSSEIEWLFLQKLFSKMNYQPEDSNSNLGGLDCGARNKGNHNIY